MREITEKDLKRVAKLEKLLHKTIKSVKGMSGVEFAKTYNIIRECRDEIRLIMSETYLVE